MVVVETSGTQGTSEPRDGDDADSLSDVALRQDEEDVQVYIFFALHGIPDIAGQRKAARKPSVVTLCSH